MTRSIPGTQYYTFKFYRTADINPTVMVLEKFRVLFFTLWPTFPLRECLLHLWHFFPTQRDCWRPFEALQRSLRVPGKRTEVDAILQCACLDPRILRTGKLRTHHGEAWTYKDQGLSTSLFHRLGKFPQNKKPNKRHFQYTLPFSSCSVEGKIPITLVHKWVCRSKFSTI